MLTTQTRAHTVRKFEGEHALFKYFNAKTTIVVYKFIILVSGTFMVSKTRKTHQVYIKVSEGKIASFINGLHFHLVIIYILYTNYYFFFLNFKYKYL